MRATERSDNCRKRKAPLQMLHSSINAFSTSYAPVAVNQSGQISGMINEAITVTDRLSGRPTLMKSVKR